MKYFFLLLILISISCNKKDVESLKSNYKEKYRDSLFLSLSPKMDELDFDIFSEDEVKKKRLKKGNYSNEFNIKTSSDTILNFNVNNYESYIQLHYYSSKQYFSWERENKGYYEKSIDIKREKGKLTLITQKVKSDFPNEEIEKDYYSYKKNLDFILDLYKSKYRNELKINFLKGLNVFDVKVNNFRKRGLESFGLNKNNLFLIENDKLIVISYDLNFSFNPNYDGFESHVKHSMYFDLKINYYFKEDFLKLENEIKKDSINYIIEMKKMNDNKRNEIEMKKNKLLEEI